MAALAWFYCLIEISPDVLLGDIRVSKQNMCNGLLFTWRHSDHTCCKPSTTVVSPPVWSTVVNGMRRSEPVVHNRRPLSWRCQSRTGSWPASVVITVYRCQKSRFSQNQVRHCPVLVRLRRRRLTRWRRCGTWPGRSVMTGRYLLAVCTSKRQASTAPDAEPNNTVLTTFKLDLKFCRHGSVHNPELQTRSMTSSCILMSINSRSLSLLLTWRLHVQVQIFIKTSLSETIRKPPLVKA